MKAKTHVGIFFNKFIFIILWDFIHIYNGLLLYSSLTFHPIPPIVPLTCFHPIIVHFFLTWVQLVLPTVTCVVLHCNLVNRPAITTLKWLSLQQPCQLHDEMLIGLISWRSCVYNKSCCEFMYAMALSCLSALYHHCLCSSWRRMAAINSPSLFLQLSVILLRKDLNGRKIQGKNWIATTSDYFDYSIYRHKLSGQNNSLYQIIETRK